MSKELWGHPEHKRTGENIIAAPRYNSVVKVVRHVSVQNPNQKTARDHKNDLYFLNQVFRAYNVK